MDMDGMILMRKRRIIKVCKVNYFYGGYMRKRRKFILW